MKRWGALLAIGMIPMSAYARVQPAADLSRTNVVQESLDQPFRKSKGGAYVLSFLGTAVPLLISAQISASTYGGSEAWISGMALGGTVLGPSLGQFYAGSHARGWIAAGVRAGGLFATAIGLSQFSKGLFCSTEGEEGSECDVQATAVPLVIAGSVLFIGGTVYSFINAGRTVDRFNDSLSWAGDFGWSPTFARSSDGSWKTGAMAWKRF